MVRERPEHCVGDEPGVEFRLLAAHGDEGLVQEG
jgi:hypothetical protein